MTAPVITSVTFDQAVYNPGDTVTMTVDYTPGTTPPAPPAPTAVNVTGVATDEPSTEATSFTGAYQVQGGTAVGAADTTTWAITDDHNGTWTQVSDSGAQAVFTSVAPAV